MDESGGSGGVGAVICIGFVRLDAIAWSNRYAGYIDPKRSRNSAVYGGLSGVGIGLVACVVEGVYLTQSTQRRRKVRREWTIAILNHLHRSFSLSLRPLRFKIHQSKSTNNFENDLGLPSRVLEVKRLELNLG